MIEIVAAQQRFLEELTDLALVVEFFSIVSSTFNGKKSVQSILSSWRRVQYTSVSTIYFRMSFMSNIKHEIKSKMKCERDEMELNFAIKIVINK